MFNFIRRINRNRRRPRVFRPRINFNVFEDFVFKEKFRIHRATFEYILNALGARLEHLTHRNHCLSPTQQILCALHWMGSGCQYHVIADAHGIHKSTVQRCVKRVSLAVTETLFCEWVRWPAENCRSIAEQFSLVSDFAPVIAGIMDGTLISINSPTQHENLYVDRHGRHSINTLMVCGPNYEFFFLSAKWPGSTHDSRVLRTSTLYREWQNGWRPFPGAVILGDSAYSLQNWLITPNIPHNIERNEAVTRFLRIFRSTRRLVENSFAIVKGKFLCLKYLRLQPTAACRIIQTAVTLHNIEIANGSENYVPYYEGMREFVFINVLSNI